jgi:hypothetical protein
VSIYHLSVKSFSRAAGRSATAAAAYRAAEKIEDKRTGEVHDYTRKGGVEGTELVLPAGAPEWAHDRAALWNAAEEAERRKNSVVAREFEVALPAELTAAQRRELAVALARELVERHGFAADVAIHQPSRHGDDRNYHAHILVSTRQLEPEGFTQKTRELDNKEWSSYAVHHWRERFAELQNQALERHGHEARVDHRTLAAQGLDREPTVHLGPHATGYERRTGEQSRRGQELDQHAQERAQVRAAAQEQARELAAAEKRLAELEREAARAALEESRRQEAEQARQETARQAQDPARQERLAAGLAASRERFEQRKRERAEQEAQKQAEQAQKQTEQEARRQAEQEARRRAEQDRAHREARERHPEGFGSYRQALGRDPTTEETRAVVAGLAAYRDGRERGGMDYWAANQGREAFGKQLGAEAEKPEQRQAYYAAQRAESERLNREERERKERDRDRGGPER